MAVAEAHLAALYNKPGHEIINHTTYIIAGDGDLMEGVASEAASFAGHQKLGKIICFYDDNGITIDGSTTCPHGRPRKRFEAYGWQVLRVDDGNDVAKIDKSL
jgi:transketolase